MTITGLIEFIDDIAIRNDLEIKILRSSFLAGTDERSFFIDTQDMCSLLIVLINELTDILQGF